MIDESIKNIFEGLEQETKVCIKCGNEKLLSEFSNNSGRPYKRPECRACSKTLSNHIKKIKKNISRPPSDYICPICLKGEEDVKHKGGKKTGAWCCDHNHETGDFRGWLCHPCNRNLGTFKDDIEALHRAIDYLKN